MDRNSSMSPSQTSSSYSAPLRASIGEPKVKETHSHYLVSMEVPHVKRDELKIELKQRKQLHVRGCFGDFFKMVTFATPVHGENIKASLVDGCLQLLLPKLPSSPHAFH